MLIAISGSQSTGKTTLLNAIKARGYKAIERKTSRSILSDWNVTLEQVNNDSELTLKFQEEIINRKFADEAAAVASDELFFTERSYADLFTYALISLGKDNKHSAWVDSYFDQCKSMQQSYDTVFFLLGGMFNVEHDGVRGSNQYYSAMVDNVMFQFTARLTKEEDLIIVGEVDIDERIKLIERTLLLPYTK